MIKITFPGNNHRIAVYQNEAGNSRPFSSGPWNWVLFFGSVFLFITNLFASLAILPGYSLAVGSSPFLAGLQNTVFAISAVLMRFFLGPVMDRNGPRSLMLAGVFTFATAPLLLLFSPTYPAIIASRIYQSLGLAVYLPGISTLTAEMAPEGRIGTYLGAARIFINLGLLAGPSAALLTINHYGYSSWFIISIVTSLFSLSLLSAVKTPVVSHAAMSRFGSMGQVKKALADARIYPVIAGIALYAFTYSAVVSFAAVHIDSIFPGSRSSLFFIILGLAGIAGCLGAGTLSDRWGRSSIAWPLLVTVGTGLVFFSLVEQWPILVIICALILGLGIQGSTLVFAAWLIDLSKPELRATTMSLQENAIDTVFALGAMAFGFAAQGPGLDRAFMFTGLITILFVFPLVILSRRITAGSPQLSKRTR